MAEITNPYANPYLPSFVSSRPRINDIATTPSSIPQVNINGTVYSQIHPVKGFEGADNYVRTLAAGSSEILTESDPGMARIYIVAKDANGQAFVQGFDLISVERPKPVTMDDLNAKMSELLERMDKLEMEKAKGMNYDAKSGNGYAAKGPKSPADARPAANSRNIQGGQESHGNTSANGPIES